MQPRRSSRRSARRRLLATAAAGVVVLGATAPPAAAQDAGAAVEDLRANDVTYEDGALTARDLADLDTAAADVQHDRAFFKVVVLAEPVTAYASPRAFAEDVLDELGGDGRVLVFDTDTVGVATGVDTPDEREAAELAAATEATRANSFATGVRAAATALGDPFPPSGPPRTGDTGDTGGSAPSGSQGSSGGGFPWVLVVLAVVAVGVVVVVVVRSRRRKAGQLDEAEAKVRAKVDRAASLVIALADRAGTDPQASAAYERGVTAYTQAQGALEEADTRDELEATWPVLSTAVWELESAEAILEGRGAPPRPADEPLFPVPPPAVPSATTGAGAGSPGVPGVPGVPGPGPRYRSRRTSPWTTGAVVAALELLAARGRRVPTVRPPMRPPTRTAGRGGLATSRPRLAVRAPGRAGDARRGMGRRGMGRR